jgi:hypothetical protein
VVADADLLLDKPVAWRVSAGENDLDAPVLKRIDDRSSTRVGRWLLVTALLAWLERIAVRGSGR